MHRSHGVTISAFILACTSRHTALSKKCALPVMLSSAEIRGICTHQHAPLAQRALVLLPTPLQRGPGQQK